MFSSGTRTSTGPWQRECCHCSWKQTLPVPAPELARFSPDRPLPPPPPGLSFQTGSRGSQKAWLFVLVISILVPSPPRRLTSYSRKEHGHPRRGPQQDPPPSGSASQRPREGKGAGVLQGERREEGQDMRGDKARVPINFRDCGRGITYWYTEACNHKE